MTQPKEQRLGRYQIVKELGGGGFATVYQAVDTKLDRNVALKILHPTHAHDSDFIRRFHQEAKVTAEWSHSNIATIFEVDQVEGRHFIVMQYIPGQNLRDLVKDQGSLSLDQIVLIIQQVGDALDYAHARGVIHRDVKPSNIIVDGDGHATLTDFGIVKVLQGTTIATTTGAILGTPYYVSPEQVESEPLDGRSDIYSLGVVAYQLLTDKVPFDADNVSSLYYKIAHKKPPLPSEINLRAAGPIEKVLLKALAKRPDDRYPSGKEFTVALRGAVEQAKEMVDSLCEEAEGLLDTGELDDTEAVLHRILAIDSSHTKAQMLLGKVGQRRKLVQRYHELVVLVNQARARAEELKREHPGIDDPEGILSLLTSDFQALVSGSTRPELTSPVPKPAAASKLEDEHTMSAWKKRLSILKITAIFLIAVSLVAAIRSWSQISDIQYTQLVGAATKMYRANFVSGLAIGIGGISCALFVFLLFAGRDPNEGSEHQISALRRQFSTLKTSAILLAAVSVIAIINRWLLISDIHYAGSPDVVQLIYRANFVLGLGIGIGGVSFALFAFLLLTNRKLG